MSKTTKWIIGIIAGVFVLFFGLFILAVLSLIFSGESGETTETTTSGARRRKSGRGRAPGTHRCIRGYCSAIQEVRENNSVRAIVFRVESPGGGVAASQEIYEEVKKTRDAGKPIVVSMGAVAASGGMTCPAAQIGSSQIRGL